MLEKEIAFLFMIHLSHVSIVIIYLFNLQESPRSNLTRTCLIVCLSKVISEYENSLEAINLKQLITKSISLGF